MSQNYANANGKLTLAEMRVYKEAFSPKSRKEIAAALGVSDATVRWHMHSILRKLVCRDRLELIYRFGIRLS